MTFKEIVKKYPHLAELHLEETIAIGDLQEKQNKNKELLLD